MESGRHDGVVAHRQAARIRRRNPRPIVMAASGKAMIQFAHADGHWRG
ncbi:MAG: hypothetical protein JNK67_31625 [Alphaproteobacteria bacterium]|nr:hypothetical protein [Alphaproteobacteria bacterium]